MRCANGPDGAWDGGSLEYDVRRILLQSVACVASIGTWVWGFVAWWHLAPGARGSALSLLNCLLPVLTFPAFMLYPRRPRAAVTFTWLLLSGGWLCEFLVRLHICLRQPCSTIDTLRIAGQTITGEAHLWMMLTAAVCLLLDYSEVAVENLRSRRGPPADPPREARP